MSVGVLQAWTNSNNNFRLNEAEALLRAAQPGGVLVSGDIDRPNRTNFRPQSMLSWRSCRSMRELAACRSGRRSAQSIRPQTPTLRASSLSVSNARSKLGKLLPRFVRTRIEKQTNYQAHNNTGGTFVFCKAFVT